MQSLTYMKDVKFIKLYRNDLRENIIRHLCPEFLITPHLRFLHLESNKLVSLADVTQYSWGSSLPKQRYLEINLRRNPWNCNGSLIWIHNHLYKLGCNTIYTNPPRKPFITNVHQLFCQSPDSRRGTTVVPRDIISSIDVSIHSLRGLAGKNFCHFASNVRYNLTSMMSFIISKLMIVYLLAHTDCGCSLIFQCIIYNSW